MDTVSRVVWHIADMQNSYAVTFAAFLLFWGRVADLYSARPVFIYGFLLLGIIDLVISFLPEKYSFFILRAVSGIAGATLIPAGFRLISAVFEPHELNKALTLYAMCGALANATGTLAAGVLEFIPSGGQGAAWRWFFRLIAAIVLPICAISFFWIPKPPGAQNDVEDKWKRLDLVGAILMLLAIVLLILGLTLGASYGFKTAGFLAPFLLTWPLCIAFFVWEAWLPPEVAILPSKTWRIPNFTLLIVFATFIYGWYAVSMLPLIEIFVNVFDETPFIASLRLFPLGAAAAIFVVILTSFPVLSSRPRWTIPVAHLAGAVGYVLFVTWSGDRLGGEYWSHLFLGGFIGSSGMQAAFTGLNVGIMTSVPPEMTGVAGAVLQVALQVGSAIAMSIQAGLLTIEPGGIHNYTNVRTSWYFQLGWAIVWLIMFLVFYRPIKNTPGDEEGGEHGRVVTAH